MNCSAICLSRTYFEENKKYIPDYFNQHPILGEVTKIHLETQTCMIKPVPAQPWFLQPGTWNSTQNGHLPKDGWNIFKEGRKDTVTKTQVAWKT